MSTAPSASTAATFRFQTSWPSFDSKARSTSASRSRWSTGKGERFVQCARGVLRSVAELILGVKRGELDRPAVARRVDGVVDGVDEVEVVLEGAGVADGDGDRGVLRRRDRVELARRDSEGVLRARFDDAQITVLERRARPRAQVQADDDVADPFLRRLYGARGITVAAHA